MCLRHLALYRFRRLAGRVAMISAVGLALLATALGVPAVAREPAAQFARDQMRVATVAYRLSLANRGRCEAVLVAQPGFVVQANVGQRLTVAAVVPGSPAQAAGLAAGDRLIALDRRELSSSGANGHVVETLHHALRVGLTTLRVAGPSGVRDLEFAIEAGCPAMVALIEDGAINAWADGTGIRITTGLLARCRNDDDLALILGHEIAHNLLRHRQRLAGIMSVASGLLPEGESSSRQSHQSEEEADRLGVSLALAANYDLSQSVAFLSGLLDRSAANSTTHPNPDRRLALLRAAIGEARQNSDWPVLPRG